MIPTNQTKSIAETVKEYTEIGSIFNKAYNEMTASYQEKRNDYLNAFRVYLEAREVKFEKAPTAEELIALRETYPAFDKSFEKYYDCDVEMVLENYDRTKKTLDNISDRISEFYKYGSEHCINLYKEELDGIAAKCQKFLK